MLNLDGKIALVTGGASGIGLAAARHFAASGAVVWSADRSDPARTPGTDPARSIRLDVTSEAAWAGAIGTILEADKRLDILVNAAGIASVRGPGDFEAIDLAEWRSVFAVNVEGTMLGCRAAVRAMVDTKTRGAIVNVASTTALHATPTLGAYGASKAAIHQLTKTVAVYCAQKGYAIRCNAVLPGMAETPMTAGLPPARRAEWEAQIPLHRFAKADEVARAIAFLASDAASYISGEGLAVDGGFLVRSGIDAYAAPPGRTD